MSSKTVLFVSCALCVIVQALGQSKGDQGAELRGYVDVNGTQYYIETVVTVIRDDAQAECEARNMTLINFETEQKFDDTVQWLSDNGISNDYVWTGALKEYNSSVWIWQSTGDEISYFRWAPGQPSVNNNNVRTCIDFSAVSQGWDDDNCNNYLLDNLITMATKMTGAAAVHFLWIFILLTIIQVQGQKSRYDNERNEKIADFRGFVHVNGTKYFIDTTPTHRDDAQAECISRDMNLISFQTEQKYDDAVQWLYDNGHEYDWMWSGALKNENSSTWIWEPIGEEISYFRWAPDEPTVNNDTIRTCISFSFWSLGWDDDNCLEYSLGYICE